MILDRVVELKGRAQQVCFIPRPSRVNPFSRVFKRIVYVVNVDIHATLERRQYLKEDVVNITSHLANMRRIHKENVAHV